MTFNPEPRAARLPDEAVATGAGARRRDTRRTAWLSRRARLGGSEGNEILTSAVAVPLTLALVVEGITLLRLSQLLGVHMFVGMLLVPVVAAKLASTGWRFARYYTRARPYVEKGPPALPMRVLAPVLVVLTVSILVTGVWLLILGHHSDALLTVHKVSFILWSAFFGVHFLVYAPRVWRSLRADWTRGRRREVPAGSLRAAVVGVALIGGVVLAVAVLPAIGAFHPRHRHHDEGRAPVVHRA